MARKKIDLTLENISIESVAAEGNAVAHTDDGMVVFVPFAVPGDIVNIRVTKKKKSYQRSWGVPALFPFFGWQKRI